MNTKTRLRFLALATLLALAAPALAAPGDTLADRVLGQRRLTTSLPFLIDGRIFSAVDVAVDRSSTPNRIYLADPDLNRVLGWSDVARFRAGMSADLVLGQPSLANGSYFDFPDEECPETASATSFCRPTRVAVSPHGDLYVVDSFNYRSWGTTARSPPTACRTGSSASPTSRPGSMPRRRSRTRTPGGSTWRWTAAATSG